MRFGQTAMALIRALTVQLITRRRVKAPMMWGKTVLLLIQPFTVLLNKDGIQTV